MIIQSLKTCSLVSHFGDVFVDPNLLVYHILFLNETKMNLYIYIYIYKFKFL
jgi:hypothetical protein